MTKKELARQLQNVLDTTMAYTFFEIERMENHLKSLVDDLETTKHYLQGFIEEIVEGG